MSIKIFIHNIFEPIYFFISIYYSKVTYNRYYKIFRKKIINKDIYIIGAGPSLNNFEISKIKNSTIILINGSYEVHNRIDKSNNIFFTTTDVQRIHNLIYKIPKKIKCIISTSKYRGILDLIKSDRKILYFHPKSSILLKKFKFFGFLDLKIPFFCPKILTLPIKKIDDLIYRNIITNPGNTSMLTILIIIMKMNPKGINLIGFDMGKFNGKHYANLEFYKNSKLGFKEIHLKKTKVILREILIYLNKKNIKFKNHSLYKLT